MNWEKIKNLPNTRKGLSFALVESFAALICLILYNGLGQLKPEWLSKTGLTPIYVGSQIIAMITMLLWIQVSDKPKE